MKLSGNKKNGRYATGSRRNEAFTEGHSTDPKQARAATKKKSTYRAAKIVIAILAVILALLVTFYIVLRVGLRPPPVKEVPKPVPNGEAAAASGEQAIPPARDKTKFTFVILGMDDGNGNTDTIMVATFDDTNYTLNVVNIPRDTLVNVSWPTKKVNSLYANGGIERLNQGMTELLGYEVDYYVKIDLDAFAKLINGIGGVYFNVPKDMYYSDPSQNLLIDLNKGPQTLDGDHALQLVRARKNVWETGDIGRVEMQQAFLKAAAEQILEKKKTIKISTLIDIIVNDIDTNLTALDLGWFAKEFLKMDAVNVNFQTIPANYYDTVNGDSYCTINVKDWLNVINTKLNPYGFEVKAEDLSILTCDANGKLYVTDDNWAGKKSWGSGTDSESLETSSKPETSVEQNPSPNPSENPSPSPSNSTTPSEEPGDSATPSSGSGEENSDISPTEPSGDVSPSPTPSEAWSDSVPPSPGV